MPENIRRNDESVFTLFSLEDALQDIEENYSEDLSEFLRQEIEYEENDFEERIGLAQDEVDSIEEEMSGIKTILQDTIPPLVKYASEHKSLSGKKVLAMLENLIKNVDF